MSTITTFFHRRLDLFHTLMIVLFGIATFLSLASLYFQFVMHLEPCPLCIAQRIAVFALTPLFLASAFIKKRISFLISTFFQLLFTLLGFSMAARQIWLIHHPDQVGSGCLPDMSILWHYMPFSDLLTTFLNGSSSCIAISWKLLGMSMPEWTLICFLLFFILIIIAIRARSLKTQ